MLHSSATHDCVVHTNCFTTMTDRQGCMKNAVTLTKILNTSLLSVSSSFWPIDNTRLLTHTSRENPSYFYASAQLLKFLFCSAKTSLTSGLPLCHNIFAVVFCRVNIVWSRNFVFHTCKLNCSTKLATCRRELTLTTSTNPTFRSETKIQPLPNKLGIPKRSKTFPY